jgi:hypothetical protein
MEGQLQKNITDLPSLDLERYENIFKLYTVQKGTKNSYYFYNILKKVVIPENIDENLIDTISLDRKLPWTTLSYKIYGTIYLWWLIYLLNKPKNIFYAEPGKNYKYFLPANVNAILNNILAQIDK